MEKLKNFINKFTVLKSKLTKEEFNTLIIQIICILISSIGIIKNLISTEFVEFLAWSIIFGINVANLKKINKK